MRAEIFAYIIYLEGPELPEFVMHVFTSIVLGPPIMGMC